MTDEELEAKFDISSYDVDAMLIDNRRGNFSEERAEDYLHENIVRESVVNGQFKQAREQCARFGLSYEHEKMNCEVAS